MHTKFGIGKLETNGPPLGMLNYINGQSVPVYVILAEVHPDIKFVKITYDSEEDNQGSKYIWSPNIYA